MARIVVVLAVLLFLAGCCYHVPFSERLSAEKKAEAVAWEKEARRNGWDGVWDARIHSLDTCPFVATGRAASLTVPPLQLISWPLHWTGLVKPHEEYLREYFKESVDEEYHGNGDDDLPPDAELWMNRAAVNVFGK